MSGLVLDCGEPAEWVKVVPVEPGAGMAVICERCRAAGRHHMQIAYMVLLKKEPWLIKEWVTAHNGCQEAEQAA